jgi:hypothetical protein
MDLPVIAKIPPVRGCRLSVVNETELMTQKARERAHNPFLAAPTPAAATSQACLGMSGWKA